VAHLVERLPDRGENVRRPNARANANERWSLPFLPRVSWPRRRRARQLSDV